MLSRTHTSRPTPYNLSHHAVRGRELSRSLPLLVAIVFLLTGCSFTRTADGGRAESYDRVAYREFYEDGTPRLEHTRDVTSLAEQPEQPAGPALTKAGATNTAETPQTEARPAPPTPAERAVGGFVWLGGVLIVLGIASLVAKKWFPILPTGGSLALIAGGVGLALAGKLLDAVPWPVWLILGGVGAVAYFGGWFSNWRAER